MRYYLLWILVLCSACCFGGCSPAVKQLSKLMLMDSPPPGSPPPGQSLVIIHCPRPTVGYISYYTNVWDSTHFIGDLGNGSSIAYVCQPGQHYFVDRYLDRVGVVEARLLPNQSYALWMDTVGMVSSFQLEPVKRSDAETWKKAATWAQENIWLKRGPPASDYEALRRKDVEQIIQDFVYGSKKDRVRHLDPEDHL